MRKIYECIKTQSDITQLKALQNGLVAYATKSHGIGFFSPQNCETNINLSNKFLNEKTSAICFSHNGELFAFCNYIVIYIIHIPTRKLINTIDTNGEEIEVMEFDPSSNYIIARSTNARVLQYRYDSPFLLSRLCSFSRNISKHKKFIGDIAFYKNRVACSWHDGTIFVVDMFCATKEVGITHGHSPVNSLCFLDQNTLISGDDDGYIDIISLKNKQKYKRIVAPFRKIKQILIMPNPNYIVVASQKNIAVFDIKKYKLIDANYIKLDKNINKITIFNEESILVAFNNKEILKIELENVKKLQSLIEHNSLDAAFDLIWHEPMLRDSKEHKELEKRYKKIYLDAIDALIEDKKELAAMLTDMFKHTQAKKDEIKSLFLAFDNYPQLKMNFSRNKLSLAYALVAKYPALEHTWQYSEMEKLWKTAFKNAQRQILLGKDAKAKSYLNQYLNIHSKRKSIQLILKQNKEFIRFLKAIENKEYKTLNHLASKNKIFKEIPTYHAIIKEMQDHLDKAKNYMKKSNLVEAKKHLFKIENISHLKDEVMMLLEECKDIALLQDAYENNDFKSCYELIDLHKHLNNTELGVLLQKHWSKLIYKCEIYALQGDIKKVKTTLAQLITLSGRRAKIGDLLRLSFHAKIQTLISKNRPKEAEKIIYSYIDIFGKDKEIVPIMKGYESTFDTTLAITYDMPKRDGWIASDIITRHL